MTALERRIRSVMTAAAASAIAGEEIEEVLAVVLADGEDVEAELVGELRPPP